ncbi:bifunctional N(6)-L-threonylcarbamoyladenine synthase/serine/threonine protein kinase [Haloplanus sp. C73]|uniref:bifunctional N(6)-L-threonylcarbamoyladenine synthase/serine/threonine protein kinase n=1 Tax=Haloplanus sp. C73 TaxID=3421641 RepID=UPI003EBF45FB
MTVRVLGIEGTAWAASAAVFEYDPDNPAPLDSNPPFIETDAYQPESGGIHPREAAEHMGEAIPEVVESALAAADGPIDAVAFSRGPGLGPCLRIVGTAARSLAGTLDVPLVGVNHMVAHLEIGRHGSGFDAPVCLNASGANAHLLGFHDGRYRVLGETMDTGVGNAIDKFTRHVGWSHPGGPKVEEAATEGEYVDLPYVVKGMDFSFSGLMSAAKDAYDEGTPVEDVCFSLQETIFAMLAEVSERALSLTGADELVLGGGVGQNARLREMLATMCAERGAEFYAPDARYLRDNAGMIAVLGAKMFVAGERLSIEESAIDPNFRPDQVDVTWRAGESSVSFSPDDGAEQRGAEAVVTVEQVAGATDRIVKRRLPKEYRHPDLDARLRRERTVAEARLTSEARRHGVPTPVVRDIDVPAATLTFDSVGDCDLGAALTTETARTVGKHLATLHSAGIVHGDPTVRNVRVGDRCYLIDFGLGYHSGHVEDHAMDCHVFGGSVRGTVAAADADTLLDAFEAGYAAVGDDAVLTRLREVEGRGRYT